MFNLCKSNIAYLEACLVGAVTVAPHWPEWQDKPGVMTYKNNAEFQQNVEFLLDHPNDAAIMHGHGIKQVMADNLMPQANMSRSKLIDALYGMSRNYDTLLPESL